MVWNKIGIKKCKKFGVKNSVKMQKHRFKKIDVKNFSLTNWFKKYPQKFWFQNGNFGSKIERGFRNQRISKRF